MSPPSLDARGCQVASGLWPSCRRPDRSRPGRTARGPPRAGRDRRRDESRRDAVRALLARDDVLVGRAADDLPAGVRGRRRRRSSPRIGHVCYLDYIATGVVATAVLFSSAFPGMFNTFMRWRFQRSYEAMLAAPVNVEELVTAEVLWIAARAGVYGLAPLLVGIVFGLSPAAGDAARGADRAPDRVRLRRPSASCWPRSRKTIDNFNYITSAVLTPMFLVAGTFFPSGRCPRGSGRRAGQPAVPLRPARAPRGARRPRHLPTSGTPPSCSGFALRCGGSRSGACRQPTPRPVHSGPANPRGPPPPWRHPDSRVGAGTQPNGVSTPPGGGPKPEFDAQRTPARTLLVRRVAAGAGVEAQAGDVEVGVPGFGEDVIHCPCPGGPSP